MAGNQFTIYQLANSLLAAEVANKDEVFLAVDDIQGVEPLSKKMSLTELQASIGGDGDGGGGGVPGTFTANSITVTAHGFTSADIGKPIGWRETGDVEIWDDADTPQVLFPISVIKGIPDANTLTLAMCGEFVTIDDDLLPAGVPDDTAGSEPNSRFLYWDLSAGKYTFDVLSEDSAYSLEILYYCQAAAAPGYSLAIALIPSRQHVGLQV